MTDTDDVCAGKRRTTMQISLSVDDKTALKVMAAERGMTVAALIHEWVDANRKEADTAWQKGTE